MPELNDPTVRSIAENILALARRDNLSIRQLYQHVGAGNSCRFLIGTASDVADEMEAWFKQGAADGFNICPATLPQGIDDMISLLLPELRRRGLFRQEYEGDTLRANLGLQPLVYGK